MAERVPEHLREEVAEIYRSLWWVKCLLATEQDRLGLILRAICALPTEKPPWLGPSAIIDEGGRVLSNWVDEHNHFHLAAVVCHIDDLLNNLRDLAAQLQLSHTETEALFAQVRCWIKSDARPIDGNAVEDRIPARDRTY